MPNYHYTKSGNLDMRYSSSKSYVSSGGSRSGPSGGGGGGGYSSYYSGGSSSGSGDLHYTKSGALDMRYNSSKAAVGAGGGATPRYSSSSESGYSPSPSTPRSDQGLLHYTKSGALDMRYNSSKAAVGGAGSTSHSSSPSTPGGSGQGLHYTKSGNLDMRYKTSKALVNELMGKLRITEEPAAGCRTSTAGHIPSHVPKTNKGLPDMRFNAAKEWVAAQSLDFTHNGAVPTWLPKLKDGRIDTHKNVVKAFFDPTKGSQGKNAEIPRHDPEARKKYYEGRCEQDAGYQRCVQQSRREHVQDSSIYIPDRSEAFVKASLAEERIKTIEYDAIKKYCTEDNKLGTGGFGTVYKGTWNSKPVAIKQLHMDKLGKSGKAQFIKEVTIMSVFSDHTNLVQMFGYSLEPACVILMEYIDLGNLSWLIHHCEEAEVEAKVSDGRIKKKLTCGIVSGMIQLHRAQVIHRDLKPQNVLVSKDYTAKIADFGFSSLRGRTASLVGTKAFVAADDDVLAGTAAYMAPELIDGDAEVTTAADVYAFGVVMNEIIHEEEPYVESYAALAARGPFGAALLAKSGKRPTLSKELVPRNVRDIIEGCWNSDSAKRLSFEDVARLLNKPEVKFPDYF